MKLKVKPGDFIVNEVADLALKDSPSKFRIYNLTKSHWDTFSLLDFICRNFKLNKKDIAVAGVKDRHGKTSQIISIKNSSELKDNYQDKNFELKFLGYSYSPVSAKILKGNNFDITLRDLSEEESIAIQKNAILLVKYGIPNYFDEQRFGSARHKQGFIGKEIFKGKFENALKLFFEPSKFDEKKVRDIKSDVLINWENWQNCGISAFGDYKKILDYLKSQWPRKAYRKALSLINRDLLFLMLNAYQSFLYNEILRLYIIELSEKYNLPLKKREYNVGEFIFYQELPDNVVNSLKLVQLPVPGFDSVIDEPAVVNITQKVLASERISLANLKVKKIAGLEVRGLSRKMIFFPENFSISKTEDDDVYSLKKKINIKFFLPKGCYATILIKKLL